MLSINATDMLPEFPKARESMSDLWIREVFNSFNKGRHPIGNVRTKPQREGESARFGDEQIDYKKISASYEFCKQTHGLSYQEFIASARQMGDSLAEQRLTGIIEHLRKNPIPGAAAFDFSGPITFERFFDLCSKVEFRFAKDNSVILPEFNNPIVDAEISAQLEHWLAEPDAKSRWEELLRLKRKEFDEREARRRLVD